MAKTLKHLVTSTTWNTKTGEPIETVAAIQIGSTDDDAFSKFVTLNLVLTQNEKDDLAPIVSSRLAALKDAQGIA